MNIRTLKLATIRAYSSREASFWTLSGSLDRGDLALTPDVAVSPKVRAAITEQDGLSGSVLPLGQMAALGTNHVWKVDKESIRIDPRGMRRDGDLLSIFVWHDGWGRSTTEELPAGWMTVPFAYQALSRVKDRLAPWQNELASSLGIGEHGQWRFGYQAPDGETVLVPVFNGSDSFEVSAARVSEILDLLEADGPEQTARTLLSAFGARTS